MRKNLTLAFFALFCALTAAAQLHNDDVHVHEAVSYTHLFVKSLFETQEVAFAGNCVGAATELFFRLRIATYEAVSYTHLDVYKRQAYGQEQEKGARSFHCASGILAMIRSTSS